MLDRLRFLYNRISERLWVRPLLICIFSIAIVFLARFANNSSAATYFPDITLESIERLLNILSSSMLVIATFAVASMVSAYASASSTATPRSFSLIISDDVSQNALSTFIGTFIFSVVALIAAKNGYYDKAGLLVLFTITIAVFGIVIVTFVSWVDQIARLGRLGSTIDKVEAAAKTAIQRRKKAATLGGLPAKHIPSGSTAVFSDVVGYVQRVDVEALQACAKRLEIRLSVTALPGTFVAPNVALAYLIGKPNDTENFETEQILKSFIIGDDRKFDEDPRFGLVVLSEIAGRALSPAVNDPGTAIDIIGTFVRLFVIWCKPYEGKIENKTKFDLIEVPELSIDDMFDDAFTAIARDGADCVEVAARLQKAFCSLASIGDVDLKKAAVRHSELALARAKIKMALSQDLEVVSKLADEVC